MTMLFTRLITTWPLDINPLVVKGFFFNFVSMELVNYEAF